MSGNSYCIEPENVWDYVCGNTYEEYQFGYVEIAYDNSYGIQIVAEQISGMIDISVIVDDEEVERVTAHDSDECQYLCLSIYDEYLEQYPTSMLDEEFKKKSEHEPSKKTRLENEKLIDKRENELDCVFFDVLTTVFNEVNDDFDDIVQEVKEITINFLSDVYSEYKIYRPMYVVDEDGKEYFNEYPYENWDLK